MHQIFCDSDADADADAEKGGLLEAHHGRHMIQVGYETPRLDSCLEFGSVVKWMTFCISRLQGSTKGLGAEKALPSAAPTKVESVGKRRRKRCLICNLF